MVRFRCPGSLDDLNTDIEVDSPVAESSRPTKARAAPKSKGKVKRSANRAEVKERIHKSKKAQKVHTKKALRLPTSKTIWVGNLPSDTTERHLITLFEKCGRITEVTIRLFQGSAVCPEENGRKRHSDGQLYASVTFYNMESTIGAMDMDGLVFNEHTIKIRGDVFELLETHPPKPQPTYSIAERGWNRLKMWTVDRTTIIPQEKKASSSRHQPRSSAPPNPQDFLVKTKLAVLKDVFPAPRSY